MDMIKSFPVDEAIEARDRLVAIFEERERALEAWHSEAVELAKKIYGWDKLNEVIARRCRFAIGSD